MSPSPAAGEVGTSLTFGVAASNNPTGWAWDFGEGATPRTPGGPSPTVQLAAAGTWVGTVRASNAAGISEPFAFGYTVTQDPGPGPQVPHIFDVTGNGGSGNPGQSLTFGATASGDPTSWSWDFGGGALPATSSDPQPTVTLDAVGTYIGSVRATNAVGTSPPFQFSFRVLAIPRPVITGVTPATVRAGSAARFEATFMGQVDSWVWDFGGGVTPNTSSSPAPLVTAGETLGVFNGTVRARNAGGTSQPLGFSYQVQAPVPASTHVITGFVPGEQFRDPPSIVIQDGRPAVAYRVNIAAPGNTALISEIRIKHATTPTPAAATDWITYVADRHVEPVTPPILPNAWLELPKLVSGTRLGVAYEPYNFEGDDHQGTRFALARNSPPVNPSDWDRYDVDAFETVGTLDFDGVPCLLLYQNPPLAMDVAIATTPTPTRVTD
ncbi:MAG TPA: PKD domain-containing protein, partial [bacterium]|nr:PKD domain-containing protein [bacterium]